jgi:hypothetical protein
MREFATPGEAQLEEARQRFAEYEAQDGLTSTAATEEIEAPHIPISRLYAVAARPKATIPADLASAMLRQPRLRQIYREFLARGASYYVPEAMAASTEDLPDRNTKGCRVRFEGSRAEPNQVYVIVELDDPFPEPEDAPSALVFCDPENFTACLELTGWRNGVVQLIVEQSSEILRLARDPRSTAYLR